MGTVATVSSGTMPSPRTGAKQVHNSQYPAPTTSEPTVRRDTAARPPVGVPSPTYAPPPGPASPAPGPGRHRGLAIGLISAAVVVIAAVVVTLIVLANHHDPHRLATDNGDQVVDATAAPDTTAAAAEDDDSDEASTTETAPSTTAGSEPGVPILVDGATDENGSVDIIQRLATALADGDWDTARSIRPDLSSDDSQLESGYGALEKSTVIATSVSPDGTDVRGAYLAWEDPNGAQQTSVYCDHWTVDPTDGVVTHEASTGLPSRPDAWSGWKSPGDVADQVGQICG